MREPQTWNGSGAPPEAAPRGLGAALGASRSRLLGGAMWIPASEDLLHSAFGRACADNRRELAGRGEGGHRAAQPEAGRGRSPQHIDAWPDSMWGTCPLCGHGEAGAEHLIIWCPGVAMARHRISGGQMSLVQTVRSEGAPARQLAAHPEVPNNLF